jgi:hypothetical protein
VLSTLSDGGTRTLTIDLEDNETFGIQSQGSAYVLTIQGTGTTFHNGGVAASAFMSGFGGQTLIMSSSAVNSDYDLIHITDRNVSVGAIDTNVDLVDSGANTYGTGIQITLNENPVPAAVQIRTTDFTGSAGLDVSTTGGIQMLSGTLSTQDGSITLQGNTTGAMTGDSEGVEVEAPLSTNTGSITVSGQGGTGTGADDNDGVRLINGGSVTTGSGAISITGASGAGSQSSGVVLETNGGGLPAVTSTSGDIAITGTSHSTIDGLGLYLTTGPIKTGSGKITLIGQGGNGTDGSSDLGVELINLGSVSTTSGDIAITGTSGPNSASDGLVLTSTGFGSPSVTSTSGNISISGTCASSGDGFGMDLQTGPVHSDTGSVTLTGMSGQGGSSFADIGVRIVNGGSVSTGSGPILIQATSRSASGGSPSAGVVLVTTGGQAELQVSSQSGSIEIDGTGDGPSYGTLISSNVQVETGGGSSVAAAAPITLKGTSGGADGVLIQSTGTRVSTTDGAIGITGSSGATSGGYGGVAIVNGGSVQTSGPDAITIMGTGNSGSVASGVLVYGGATIQSSGNGGITIGGASAQQYGVYLSDSGSQVSSADGNIDITGSTAATNTSLYGIVLQSGAAINSTGTGPSAAAITLHGSQTGGGKGLAASASTVTSVDGAIAVTGDGTSGVSLSSSTSFSASGQGTVSITATNGPLNVSQSTVSAVQSVFLAATRAADDNESINIVNGSTVRSSASSATLQAGNNFQLDAGSTVSAGSQILLAAGSGAADAMGSTIAIQGAFQSTQAASVTGSPVGNTVNFFPTATSSSTSLNGGAGHDVFNLALTTLTNSISIVDPANNQNDTLNESFSKASAVNMTDTATRIGSIAVSYVNLGTVAITGSSGSDTFGVTPSQTVTFSVDGAGPLKTMSNTLYITEPPGQTSTVNPSGPGAGTVTTTGGYLPITFQHIATTSLTTSPTVTTFSVLYAGGHSYDLLANPARVLPWKITGIRATFSEPVVGTLQSLSFSGTGAPTLKSFFGSGTNTLTWWFTKPVSSANMTASLASDGGNGIIDTHGAPLDGNGSSPSPLSQAIEALYGDVDGSGMVDNTDVGDIMAYINSQPEPVAPVFLDVNGDGSVDSKDVAIVRGLHGSHL